MEQQKAEKPDQPGQREPAVRAELSALLASVNAGSAAAFSAIVDTVYDDLRRAAARRMSDQFHLPLDALTLAPTAIVNDALMELRRQRAAWRDSDHFFAVATLLIRRLVLQYQRHRLAEKRGGGRRGASVDDTRAGDLPDGRSDGDPAHAALGNPALEALARLHEAYPRKAEVVSLHVLCGHSLPKVAAMIGISLPTAERDWRFARAWMKAAFTETAGDGTPLRHTPVADVPAGVQPRDDPGGAEVARGPHTRGRAPR